MIDELEKSNDNLIGSADTRSTKSALKRYRANRKALRLVTWPNMRSAVPSLLRADDPKDAAAKAVGAMRRKPPAYYNVVGQDGYTFHVEMDERQVKGIHPAKAAELMI